MATLAQLETAKVLSRYKHIYPAIDGAGREIWFFEEVARWLLGTFMKMEPFYAENIAPGKQAAVLLKNFVTGEAFVSEVSFWHMRPYEKDIFELKTADLRLFGWFYAPKVFVAAAGDTFENTHRAPGIHSYYRDEVVRLRDKIDLDPPKWVVGASADYVF